VPVLGGAAIPTLPALRFTTVPSGVLIHPWAKNWARAVPFFLGRAGSPSNTVTWAKAYLHTKWHLSPSATWPQWTLAENLEGGCAPLGEGELGPHLTVSSRLRPASVSHRTFYIYIHMYSHILYNIFIYI